MPGKRKDARGSGAAAQSAVLLLQALRDGDLLGFGRALGEGPELFDGKVNAAQRGQEYARRGGQVAAGNVLGPDGQAVVQAASGVFLRIPPSRRSWTLGFYVQLYHKPH